MKVWIVTKGESGQGLGVEAVASTAGLARENARGLVASGYGDWVEDGADRWTNGCDVIEVNAHEVEEPKRRRKAWRAW